MTDYLRDQASHRESAQRLAALFRSSVRMNEHYRIARDGRTRFVVFYADWQEGEPAAWTIDRRAPRKPTDGPKRPRHKVGRPRLAEGMLYAVLAGLAQAMIDNGMPVGAAIHAVVRPLDVAAPRPNRVRNYERVRAILADKERAARLSRVKTGQIGVDGGAGGGS